MEIEVWKSVVGYEGLYEVNNLGKIRSLNYKMTGTTKEILGWIRLGYKRVDITKDKKSKTIFLHRLVAEAFIGKEIGKCINHIDGNKLNNSVENLEWVTQKENVIHSWKTGLTKKRFKKVSQFSLLGDFLRNWDSIKDAKESLKISGISPCCKGKAKSAGGFIWKHL